MAKAQDLLFGFNPDFVVPKLTTKNWQRSALVNLREGRRIYCFIVKHKLAEDLGGGCVYTLKANDLDTKERYGPFGWEFPTLKEALSEANQGEPVSKELLQRRWAEVSLVGVRRPQPEVPPPTKPEDDPDPAWDALEQAFRALGAHLSGGGSIREGDPGHDLLKQAANTINWEKRQPKDLVQGSSKEMLK
jgi:hypothetical protein